MLPLVISGVQIGVIINTVAPNIVIVFCFVLLLGYIGVGLIKKAHFLITKENTIRKTKAEAVAKAAAELKAKEDLEKS